MPINSSGQKSNPAIEIGHQTIELIKESNSVNGFFQGSLFTLMLVVIGGGTWVWRQFVKSHLQDKLEKADDFIDRTDKSIDHIADTTNSTYRRVDSVRDLAAEIKDLHGKTNRMSQDLIVQVTQIGRETAEKSQDITARLQVIEHLVRDSSDSLSGELRARINQTSHLNGQAAELPIQEQKS